MPDTETQPTLKAYLAKAYEKKPAVGEKAKEVTFVIRSTDYKTAWQDARTLTRVGSTHFTGEAFTDASCQEKMDLIPGTYTVHNVDSLEKKTPKVAPATVDDFLAALNASGKKVSKDVMSLIEELKEKGPLQAQDGHAETSDEPAADADADGEEKRAAG